MKGMGRKKEGSFGSYVGHFKNASKYALTNGRKKKPSFMKKRPIIPKRKIKRSW